MTSLVTSAEPTDAPPAGDPAEIGPRLYGVIDVIRPDRIAGWAIDRADSRTSLHVDILRDGEPVASVRADRPRKDLERGSVGTGKYGFSCPITPPLEPGFEFTVTAVARTQDGVSTELRRVGAADPERRLLERIYEELVRPRAAPAADPSSAAATALQDAVARIEVAQARIEATLGGLAAPEPRSQSGLRLLLALALAVGVGSLVLGVRSMLFP